MVVIEQSLEKSLSIKKYMNNNYDWSSSLIIASIRERFHQEEDKFSTLVKIVLSNFETTLNKQNKMRAESMTMLIGAFWTLENKIKMLD